MRTWWLAVLTVACRVPDHHYTGLGLGDGGGDGPDGLPPGVAVPRLIAPLSTSTVMRPNPTLRWALTSGAGSPVVDLCRDRACAQPIAITAQVATDQLSAIPATLLPSGWVYWRVRVVDGANTITTPTWQFWVGKTGAASTHDGSTGATLDVNGDGYTDFLVGAPAASGGAAHLYLGGAGASTGGAGLWNGGSPPNRIDLANPAATAAGFGYALAGVGDVNGDGFADYVVGDGNGAGAGAAYVYLGSATPAAAGWNGTTPSKRIDLLGVGGTGDTFGGAIAGIGDVNGDGYADFLVGANSLNTNVGAAYVYLGSANPSTTDWNGGVGTTAKRIELPSTDLASGLYFGATVAAAGDVNGDGFADFLVADYAGNTGAAHLYLGSAAPTATSLNSGRMDLAPLDGNNGGFGSSMANAGDVDSDGFSDFVIGGHGGGGGVGAAHVYFGSSNPSLTGWNSTATPVRRVDIAGPDGASASFGWSVATAGDVNRDGYADFAVGAQLAAGAKGIGHVYFGSAAPSSTGWGQPGGHVDIAGTVASGEYGFAVAGAGDLDGDGYTDYAFGSPFAASPKTTVCFGGSSGLAACVDVTNPDGASSQFGHTASGQD